MESLLSELIAFIGSYEGCSDICINSRLRHYNFLHVTLLIMHDFKRLSRRREMNVCSDIYINVKTLMIRMHKKVVKNTEKNA